MEFRIRPFKENDIADINEIRSMRGVIETIPTLFSESVAFTEEVMKSVGPNDPVLSAVIDTPEGEKVISNGVLRLTEKARLRHTASVALIVHADYQNMGVGLGRTILSQLMEIADKWLMLVRVDLDVAADNAGAIHLYESLGFQIEGRLKYAFMKDGKYADLLIMGRYNLP
ncbi:MAG: GNAT family N-acetyltransferase [Synergistaceae bacterium]|nr:GNAT family N-acetyltransferase [Synergistaceae bacterium]